MAAISIPTPGTELGPCAQPCEHRDCAANRAMAEAICTVCEEPIGYERRFFAGPVHYLCEIQRVAALPSEHDRAMQYREAD